MVEGGTRYLNTTRERLSALRRTVVDGAIPTRAGAEGERRTEAELRKLGDEWHVEHDLVDGRGNWDHVVIGAPGVFVIDSKTYHRPAAVVGDELRSGRIRTGGRSFRGQAFRLKGALERATGRATWVQAIVVVHGEFPQAVVETDNVACLQADRLVEWLRGRPIRLASASAELFADALRGQSSIER